MEKWQTITQIVNKMYMFKCLLAKRIRKKRDVLILRKLKSSEKKIWRARVQTV